MMIRALAPSLRPDALPAVHLPIFGTNAGGSFGEVLEGDARPGSARPCRIPWAAFGLRDFHAHDLVGEVAFLRSARSTLLWLLSATTSISRG